VAYEIELVPAAARQLKKIKPKGEQKEIAASIRALGSDPFPSGYARVVNLPDFWRIKSESKEYRIVYTVIEDEEKVIVARIARRRDVYDRLADVKAAFKAFTSRK
jgi:mRNA-degrading endonuclease RelE of RelBE toxin-antitoxin system